MRYHPFRHLGLKVLSIALALLLWLTVARDPVSERTLRVPLQFQRMPQELTMVGEPPIAVDVKVRGPSATIGQLDPGELVAVVDLRTARMGSRLFPLPPDQILAPFGVTVEQVSPPTISLAFEPTLAREVPVVPAVDGEPAPGFVVGTVSSDPPKVVVIGAEGRVRQVTEATTEPVSVAGASTTFREQVNIGVIQSEVRLRDVRAASVTVTIVPAPIERRVEAVPVGFRNMAARRRGRAGPVTVTLQVRGTREVLADLDDKAFQAFVDVAGLGAGRYDLPVQVDAPIHTAVTRVDPPTVRITIW